MRRIRLTLLLLLLFLQGIGVSVWAQQNASQVVLMMPFCSKQILENPNHSNAMLGNLCREYYQGALIAADSLEQLEVNLKLTVLDTQNDSLITQGLLKKQVVKDADLIIGPVMQGGNKLMSDFSKGKDVMHVSPLMTTSKTKINDPNFVAPNPNVQQYAKILVDFIKAEDPTGMIMVISDKSSLDKTLVSAFKQLQLQQKGLKIKIVDYTPTIDLQSYLLAGIKTHIIIPSSAEKTVKKTLHSVKDTSLFSMVSVYGFPQWMEFKSPDYVLWQQAHVHIITPFHIDYTREDVKRFVESYRTKFYTDPTEAAFKGYDQLLYLAINLNEYGRKFMTKVDGKPSQVLHTTFKFEEQEDQSGYQNMYLNMLQIENFSLQKRN
jgi:ABC-type branched-subunit amino acid transport system substrate-binding protein